MKKSFINILAIGLLVIFSTAHAQFANLVNPGPLSSPHQYLEGIKNCTQCHASASGVPDEKCLACHKEIQERLNQRKGYHAHVTGDCVKCHGEHKGADYDVTGLSRLTFDHTDTGWPLTGKHQPLDCPNCHTKMRKNIATGAPTSFKTYLGNNSNCKSCHKDPHKSTKPAFQQCYKCHDTSSWQQREQSNFNHNKETEFQQIVGKHAETACYKCHQTKAWAPLAKNCVNCHKDPHDGQFGKTCENCHNPRSWTGAGQGAAAGGGSSAGAAVGAGLATKGLKGGKAKGTGAATKITAGFDHNKTAFPLTGKHKGVTCKSCHGPVIGKMENFQDCVGCHRNPHGKQFSMRWTEKPCSSCHVTDGFKKLSFEHNKDSRFDILGKHTKVKCASCHPRGRFRWLESTPDCVVCHVDVHKGAFAPKPCASCHTYDGFKMFKQQPAASPSGGMSAPVAAAPTAASMVGFDHNKTPFPLVGRHQAVACESCHAGGVFKGLGHACNTCHNDLHKGELGNECERCHSPAIAFNDIEFDHNRQSKFRIDGQHVKNQCNQCHVGNKYKLGDLSCATCHSDVHRGKFGADCNQCHTTSGFQSVKGTKAGVTVDKGFHNFGSFRITGVHNKLNCNTCHNPQAPARARPMECSSCHKDPHMNSLGTECYTCHGQTAWMPTTFRHNQTGFELSGAHRFLSCDRCHFNRVFGGLSSECFFCHMKDFNASLPQHVGAPTTCNTCHYTYGFRPAKR